MMFKDVNRAAEVTYSSNSESLINPELPRSPNEVDMERRTRSLETLPVKMALASNGQDFLVEIAGASQTGFENMAIELNPLTKDFKNPNTTTVNMFVNGINLDQEKLREIRETVPDTFGRTMLVVNPPNRVRILEKVYNLLDAFGLSWADDVRDIHEYLDTGFLMCASELTHRFAPGIVRNLAHDMLRQLDAGMNIRIIGHSKGAVIAVSALYYLKHTLPEQRWIELAPKITLYNFGIGLDRVPSGIKAATFVLNGDKIARWTSKENPVYRLHERLVRRRSNRMAQEISPVILGAIYEDPHSVREYMRLFPVFYAQLLHTNNEISPVKALGLADRAGLFSDHFVSEVAVALRTLFK